MQTQDKSTQPDFNDLQGIVRFAHGRMTQSCFYLLKIRDAGVARKWLADAPVTTAAFLSPLPEKALQVAFTADGLSALGVKKSVIEGFSEAFLSGMTAVNRSRRLGDVGVNSPENWQWGCDESNHPDMLLMLYTCHDGLDAWQEQIITDEFNLAFIIQQHLDTNGRVGDEPFGFADGISQPKIDWKSEQSTDLHTRDHYSNLLAPGEVVLGYPNEYGEYTDRPLINKNDDITASCLPDAQDKPQFKDFGRNGSYLVFRQLGQDVPGFWRFVDKLADGDPQRREELAQLMVGRKRDGTPLVPLTGDRIPGIAAKNSDINLFDFDEDPEGLLCPIGSHIRRSNPRTGDFPPGIEGLLTRFIAILGLRKNQQNRDLVASSRFHRILRRGRQYGPGLTMEDALTVKDDHEQRGLHFICLSANIARQFEFVQNAWIVNSKFGGLQNESDPLLGSRQALIDGSRTDNFSYPQISGPRKSVCSIPQFVTVQGGGYFFLPGISALNYITSRTDVMV